MLDFGWKRRQEQACGPGALAGENDGRFEKRICISDWPLKTSGALLQAMRIAARTIGFTILPSCVEELFDHHKN